MDFKGFKALAEKLSPKELVADIHQAFTEFDRIIAKYNIEKIKTIGDAYMAAGGLPIPNKTHHTDVVQAALEIRDFIAEGKRKKIEKGLPYFEIRIGVHTGPVVAGIVGVKKFSYDIWGDTVNIASRMESSAEIGKINVSKSTFDLLKDDKQLNFEHRGKIKAKGKGEVDMYFVEKIKT
jgi:class 3 adenylate cyclase